MSGRDSCVSYGGIADPEDSAALVGGVGGTCKTTPRYQTIVRIPSDDCHCVLAVSAVEFCKVVVGAGASITMSHDS